MTSRTSISADELYLGSGDLPGANPDNRKGVRVTPTVYVDWGALAASIADGIISDATSTEIPGAAGTTTYTASTDGTAPQDGASRPAAATISVAGVEYAVLDLGPAASAGKAVSARNLVSVVTHGSSVVALTIKHYGFDINKRPMTETHAITAGTTSKTVTGKKAFRYWWKTDITAAADASANTVRIGTGNIFGLPYRITTLNGAIALRDGAVDTGTKLAGDTTSPATVSTGDVRGTVDFTTDPNATANYAVWIMVPDVSAPTPIHGVTQV